MNSFKESELPTLIVDKYQDVYLMGDARHTICIDGPLPTVEWLDLSDPNTVSGGHRPLRAGDRVALATKCETCQPDDGFPFVPYCPDCGGPFATATVERIGTWEPPIVGDRQTWYVAVADVETLG